MIRRLSIYTYFSNLMGVEFVSSQMSCRTVFFIFCGGIAQKIIWTFIFFVI